MSNVTNRIKQLGGRIVTANGSCTCGYNHCGPCPKVLLEFDGVEMWVSCTQVQPYLDEGWGYCQRGAPFAFTIFYPDDSKFRFNSETDL